jgi:hypothetical protein
MFCGSDSSAVASSNVDVYNEAECLDRCDQTPGCTGASYIYQANGQGEPKDGDTTKIFGKCYLRNSADPSGDQYAPNTNFARRVAVVSSSTSSTSTSSSARPSSSSVSSSSSTSSAPATTSVAPATTTSAAPVVTYAAAPVSPWNPAISCANGGSDTAGGRYTDTYGAEWEVRCQNDLSGVSTESTGTEAQGIYACWKGCMRRPGCSAFVFDGTIGRPESPSMCRGFHYFVVTNADIA